MLRIGFPSSAKFNKKKAEASSNIDRMTEAITVVVGTPDAACLRADRG